MSRFEHQVASHLIAEGLIDEGMILTRVIHDRYHAKKRNPFNDIECSDHYARAMASYGTFIAACGFDYHGPKGFIQFSPKWGQAHFSCPFTTAKGWGTYTQDQVGTTQIHRIQLLYGSLWLRQCRFDLLSNRKIKELNIICEGKSSPVSIEQSKETVQINLKNPLTIELNQVVEIQIRVKYDHEDVRKIQPFYAIELILELSK